MRVIPEPEAAASPRTFKASQEQLDSGTGWKPESLRLSDEVASESRSEDRAAESEVEKSKLEVTAQPCLRPGSGQ